MEWRSEDRRSNLARWLRKGVAMTATQTDLVKRYNVLMPFMFDSEQRAVSDWIQLGRYNRAYGLIKEIEKRVT